LPGLADQVIPACIAALPDTDLTLPQSDVTYKLPVSLVKSLTHDLVDEFILQVIELPQLVNLLARFFVQSSLDF